MNETIARLTHLAGIPLNEGLEDQHSHTPNKIEVTESAGIRLPLIISNDEWQDLLMSVMSRMNGSKKLEDGWDQKVPGILADYFKQRILDHSFVDELASKGAFDQLTKQSF